MNAVFHAFEFLNKEDSDEDEDDDEDEEGEGLDVEGDESWVPAGITSSSSVSRIFLLVNFSLIPDLFAV